MKKHFYFLLLFFLPYAVFSQANSNFLHQLDKNINDYYKLERENIHAHFSKSIYFTNEKIWLSGYVFTQQTKLPSIHTNNVFLEILDSQGNLYSRHLLFSTNGVFQATLPLNKTMPSGIYYFRFYTHYMNNFQENIAAVFPVEIINYDDKDYDANKSSKYADLFIEMFPEAGALSFSNPNNIAVKVTNYLGEGIATKTAKVFDKQNNLITTFSTNNYGYGKFEIKNPENTTYRVEVENHGFTYKQELNFIATNDLSLAVDSYSFADKTTIAIKNINRSSSKNYYLLLSQNNKILAFPIEKNKPTFVLDNQVLFDGVNTARIIDEQNNVYATRLFYIHKENSENKSTNDEIAIYSYSAYALNSKVIPERNIYNSIYINPYTQEAATYDGSYFSAPNRIKKYELDMFMMFQKPKEIFTNITSATHPSVKYAFERGIDIQGTLTQDIKSKKDNRIRMVSYPDLHEFSNINENNEFIFDHLVVADSINVHFSLLSKNDKPKDLSLYPKIIGSHRKYIKNLNITLTREAKDKIEMPESELPIALPTSKYQVILEDIKIKGTTLKREKQNPMLRGFKASDIVGFENMRVTDFLRQYRFHVDDNLGTSIIYSSYSDSRVGRGKMMPAIFIDGTQQFDHFYVNQLWMSHVDEIYFDRTYTIIGMNNNFMNSDVGMMGIVKIYTKNPGEILRKKEAQKAFQITGGFTRFLDFENDVFDENDPALDLYGNIFWESRVNSKKGNLKYKIPKQGKKKVKIFVEGITSDGTIFSKVEEISSN